MKLNAIRRQQRGEGETEIVCALQVPKMPIHTILKSTQENEATSLNLLKHKTVKVISHRSDVMEITKRRLVTWIEDLYQQHIPVSLALFQKKAVTLHEAGKEASEAAEVKPLVHQEAGFSTFRSGMASKI